jgi:CubicO group peptidase (beta-lactamase class C family)
LTRVGGDARKPPDVTKKPLLFSGGAGLVASAADYPHFAQMLLNEGEYGNVRLLAPHTVRLMTSNALPPDVGYADIARRMGDIGPTGDGSGVWPRLCGPYCGGQCLPAPGCPLSR